MLYNGWTLTTVAVEDLRLDADNPRLLVEGRTMSQAELIADLVRHEDVKSVADSIASDGYFPTEFLIVAEEDGEYVVLEGNRRLAAVKLLRDPTLAPQTRRKLFQALQKKGAGRIPDVLPIAIAPHRTDADKVILKRHTSDSVKRWSPYMQARFIERLIDAGDAVDSVATRLEETPDWILRRYRMAKAYRLALKLKISSEAKDVLEDPRQFNLSAVARVLENAAAQEFLGLKPDAKHGFVVKSNATAFCAAFGRLVEDVAIGRENTRSLNTDEDIKGFLRRIKHLKPKTQRGAKKPLDTLAGGAAGGHPKPDTTAPQKQRRAETVAVSMLPPGVKCASEHPRVILFFEELKKLSVRTRPNTSAVAFRCFVELATAEWLHTTGRLKSVYDWCKKRNPAAHRKGWLGPALEDMLCWLTEIDPHCPFSGTELSAVKRFVQRQRQGDPTSLRALHDFVHNRHMEPVEDHLRAIGMMLKPLLDVVLAEPGTSSGGNTNA